MKKYIIIALCIINNLSCMELEIKQQIVKPEPRKWDAQAYDDGSKFQRTVNQHLLKSNNIKTAGLKILELGCGTGHQAAELSEKAKCIHAIDASEDMIAHAKKKFGHIPNVSFEQCYAEEIQRPQLYNLVIASCCIHYFYDIEKAFQRINDHLEKNGQFFANVQTADLPTAFTITVFREMLESIPLFGEYLSECVEPTGNTTPTNNQLDTMLEKTGFTIIKRETQSSNWTDTQEEFRNFLWPIVTSSPGAKYIPSMLIQPFFNEFLKRCLAKLKKNEDGTYTWAYYTEVVHAYKK